MKVCLIPDSHVTQDTDLSRFVGLGNLIVDKKPDTIISMGDFLAMESISHWDKDKRLTMEGKRYLEEVSTARAARKLIDTPTYNLQERQRELKTRQYKPKKYYLMGNHEVWIDKYTEQNPAMKDYIDLDSDLGLTENGWEILPFGEYLELHDILFTHVPLNGARQSISGVDICRIAGRYTNKSLVFGHTHRFETANMNRLGGGSLIQVLTCGCFFEDKTDGFGFNNWKGVIFLDVFAPGRFEISTHSIERLRYELD